MTTGSETSTPSSSTPCPRCKNPVPEDDEHTGEGPVYWTVTGEPFCSMECVIGQSRDWLEEERRKTSHLFSEES